MRASGRSAAKVAAELGIRPPLLYRWAHTERAPDLGGGRRPGRSLEELVVVPSLSVILGALVTAETRPDSSLGLVFQVPPVGAVLPYAGTKVDEKQTGWLLCDGRSLPVPTVPTDQYSSLYQVIGGTYGSEARNGHRFFRLPHLRGRGSLSG
jgi:hypothetical protein